jgi:hypothetical protein
MSDTEPGPDDGRSPGPLLLQGGGEMQPPCRDMDAELLEGVDEHGVVVVLLGAASPGDDFSRTAERAWTYYEPLVGLRQIDVAPHPEDDLDACVRAVAAASLLVVPGGSPSRLLRALTADGGRLGGMVTGLHRDGVPVSGSSAGAMVLCARTVLPDRRGGGSPAVVDGLGLVPGLALVHDDGAGDRGWRDPADPDGLRWGLPEHGGVLVHDGAARAVGRGRVRLLRGERRSVVAPYPTGLERLQRF